MDIFKFSRSQVLAIVGGLIVLFCLLAGIFQFLLTAHINMRPFLTVFFESVSYNMYSRLLTIAAVILSVAYYYNIVQHQESRAVAFTLALLAFVFFMGMILMVTGYYLGLLQIASGGDAYLTALMLGDVACGVITLMFYGVLV